MCFCLIIPQTGQNEEKENVLIENTAECSLRGNFIGEIEGGEGQGQTEEK